MADVDSFRRRVGTTLRGKWRLERLIGVGGMAAVYAAEHKIGRREAIKILHPEVASSPEVAERFEQEAHAANRFRHPGAVVVRDYDVTEDGALFLVMELLEGESLGQRLAREAVPLGDALRYADELLDVLAAAHAQGIIHRDVKPDNLFLTDEGGLKVLDFGIARVLGGPPRTQQTAAGRAMGTPHYMAPEQVMGGEVDARTDVYAVGATLFRLASGRHPHDAATEMELFVKVASEPAPRLRAVAPGAPASLGLVVDRALALRPEDRYPDARTMQGDVQALRRGQAPPFVSAPSSRKIALFGRGGPSSRRFPAADGLAAAGPGKHAGDAAPPSTPGGYRPAGLAPATPATATSDPSAATYVPPGAASSLATHVPPGAASSLATHVPPGAASSLATHVPPGAASSLATHVPPGAASSAATHVPSRADASAATFVPPGGTPSAVGRAAPGVDPAAATQVPGAARAAPAATDVPAGEAAAAATYASAGVALAPASLAAPPGAGPGAPGLTGPLAAARSIAATRPTNAGATPGAASSGPRRVAAAPGAIGVAAVAANDAASPGIGPAPRGGGEQSARELARVVALAFLVLFLLVSAIWFLEGVLNDAPSGPAPPGPNATGDGAARPGPFGEPARATPSPGSPGATPRREGR